MQNLPIYLYPNTLNVILDSDATTRGVNQIMYQRDLTIQKGIKNQIRIQFKNSDQKRVSVATTQTFVFSMFDAINQRLIIEKDLEILNETTSTKGVALLTLNESDTLDLDRSSYQYSVKQLDADGTYTPAYANAYYGIAGTLHIASDIFPVLKDSNAVDSFLETFDGALMKYKHISGNIYAYPEFNGNNALHTLAIYMRAYKGTVYVEATLDNSPSANANYTVIAQSTYTGFTGVDYINVNGVYSYIRIKHIPDKSPLDAYNNNPTYYGSLDKILYRC